MEFVLALHSHLPYVLNHGRWPHGSDWLCEAALDTYLPLLERLQHSPRAPSGTALETSASFLADRPGWSSAYLRLFQLSVG